MGKLWIGCLASAALLLVACTDTSPGDSTIVHDAGSDAYEVIDAGGPIAMSPNGSAACPAAACNYQTGAGCSGATPSCEPVISGGVAGAVCSTAGNGESDATCMSSAECAVGYACLSADAVSAPSCHKLCCGGDWSACPSAKEHCIVRVGSASVDTGAMACVPIDTCDALTPASCTAPGTSCQIADATGATACLPAGTGDVREPCPCKGGFTCVGGACLRLCKAVEGGGEPFCQPGEGACVHFSKDPPGVGECMPWVTND